MKRLVIAGVTGSIGSQALEVLHGHEEIEIVGVTAGSNGRGLLEAMVQTGAPAGALKVRGDIDFEGFDVEVGDDAAVRLIRELEPDLVLNAVVGFAGLAVTQAALESGADLALANKESLVAGGDLVMNLAARQGLEITPVDSEHASLAQLLSGVKSNDVERLVLTASGGPFRGRTAEELSSVTVSEALAHPTWKMGGKISIDSATLMNKGLELIEAHHLFAVPYDQLGVVVHPQSLVHAVIELIDGMQIAHLGVADMRAPIAWAVDGGNRRKLDIPRLDLASAGSLTFEEPDPKAFPALAIAIEAGRAGGGAPAVLNASNEVAVEAFLSGGIAFTRIPEVVALTLDVLGSAIPNSFEELTALDQSARSQARSFVEAVA